jgi:hypothetical protein
MALFDISVSHTPSSFHSLLHSTYIVLDEPGLSRFPPSFLSVWRHLSFVQLNELSEYIHQISYHEISYHSRYISTSRPMMKFLFFSKIDLPTCTYTMIISKMHYIHILFPTIITLILLTLPIFPIMRLHPL